MKPGNRTAAASQPRSASAPLACHRCCHVGTGLGSCSQSSSSPHAAIRWLAPVPGVRRRRKAAGSGREQSHAARSRRVPATPPRRPGRDRARDRPTRRLPGRCAAPGDGAAGSGGGGGQRRVVTTVGGHRTDSACRDSGPVAGCRERWRRRGAAGASLLGVVGQQPPRSPPPCGGVSVKLGGGQLGVAEHELDVGQRQLGSWAIR